jgi:putative flippase GtrA
VTAVPGRADRATWAPRGKHELEPLTPSRAGQGGTHVLEEIARFLAVGGLATVVAIVGFNALVHGLLVDIAPMQDHPVPAFVLANVVGGVVAFVGMRLWAFSHREVRDPVGGVVRFFALGGLTMLIPVACLAVSRYALGLTDVWADNISANVVGLGLGTAARFWVFRRFVFVDVGVAPTVPETGAA